VFLRAFLKERCEDWLHASFRIRNALPPSSQLVLEKHLILASEIKTENIKRKIIKLLIEIKHEKALFFKRLEIKVESEKKTTL
jgi:hypothetical protein